MLPTKNQTYTRNSLLLFIAMLTLYFSMSNCNNVPQTTNVDDGQVLAKKYCSTCHQYPQPALVDLESWEKHILPSMAKRMGIQVYGEDMYVNNPNAKTLVTFDEWSKIVSFYKSNAPKALKPYKDTAKHVSNWSHFILKKPSASSALSTTTMVAYDKFNNKIYTSDMNGNNLYQWSDKLVLQKEQPFNSPAVDARFYKDGNGDAHGDFTFIGSMDAYDRDTGVLTDIDLKNINNKSEETDIAPGLNRAVQSISADFNEDGLKDWVVCQFGHNRGALTLYTQKNGGTYTKKDIRPIAGATNVITGDYNNDGWPDLMCLFAQGDEGIWMFLNDQKGGFVTKKLLGFPPIYGSTSFQLVDFNNDGKLDILYTCGDNSDYSRVLKPYHGVYVFLNQGDFKYKQAWFYHINGATKAVAADFNGDKKLDIAVIAFFSDLKDNPAEGFTYLEQNSPMKFTANNIPVDKHGRWICMDVKDCNGDGKPDIILGNFSVGFINQDGVKKDWDAKTPFVVLYNDFK